jgi:hypothetical protein
MSASTLRTRFQSGFPLGTRQCREKFLGPWWLRIVVPGAPQRGWTGGATRYWPVRRKLTSALYSPAPQPDSTALAGFNSTVFGARQVWRSSVRCSPGDSGTDARTSAPVPLVAASR